ncbi:MAG: DUF362 domain-containing protein [Deltaproteobacteria bacterium]|jgi:uncharacterized protein (DUF362 family)|nr:DUF362 domain-containing protein [Deltaproteobacteria bacterium]MBW2534114.1 DUF362 domain-containing protein [Deltaproteobacteria bacterium]
MADVTRREAIKRIGKAALVLGGAGALTRACWDRAEVAAAPAPSSGRTRDYRVTGDDPDAPAMAIAHEEPPEGQRVDAPGLVRRAIDALGGMSRFVSRGDVVVVKPNIGWDRTPAQAANTNPGVVGELCRAALSAGAAKVVVTDFSCNDPDRAFARSGIAKAARDAGAEVVLPAEHRFRTMPMGGEVLEEWPIFVPLVEADKVINAPVAKHHGLAKLTCALKNWYGIIGGTRNRLHQRIDVSIADLAAFMQPTLTVVDATRVLWRNGPQGGNLADTRDENTVVASIDQVAADAYCSRFVGVPPEQLGYLELAEQRGLGTRRWRQLRRVEV